MHCNARLDLDLELDINFTNTIDTPYNSRGGGIILASLGDSDLYL